MAINILDILNSDTVFGIPQQMPTGTYYKTDTGVDVDENLPVEGGLIIKFVPECHLINNGKEN